MSKAVKCDRCEKCFDITKPGIWVNIRDMVALDARSQAENKYVDHITSFDLCPECAEKHRKFLNEKDTEVVEIRFLRGDTDGD